MVRKLIGYSILIMIGLGILIGTLFSGDALAIAILFYIISSLIFIGLVCLAFHLINE